MKILAGFETDCRIAELLGWRLMRTGEQTPDGRYLAWMLPADPKEWRRAGLGVPTFDPVGAYQPGDERAESYGRFVPCYSRNVADAVKLWQEKLPHIGFYTEGVGQFYGVDGNGEWISDLYPNLPEAICATFLAMKSDG